MQRKQTQFLVSLIEFLPNQKATLVIKLKENSLPILKEFCLQRSVAILLRLINSQYMKYESDNFLKIR